MKEKKSWIQEIKRIDLVDRCIMLILIILMAQTIFNLFTHHAGQNEAIDIVIRTSLASLFGYIISANFIRHESSTTMPNETPLQPEQFSQLTLEDLSTSSINLTSSNQDSVMESMQPTGVDIIDPLLHLTNPIENKEKFSLSGFDQKSRPHDIQILFITAIGLIALISLLMANNLETIDETLASTISQLRDFVSGSIGFLIGCSTHNIES